MVSSNKILTVSYGTFSCTLEGFDNSFDTMKAIAEYFRDLAQDDRYFGAEPPTPDAEMLARIAEREIERRVEARFEKGNLVLRASDEAEPPQGDVAPDSSSTAALVGATAGVAATSPAVADTEDQSGTPDLSGMKDEPGETDIPDLTSLAERSDEEGIAEEDVTVDLSEIDLSDMAFDIETAEDIALDDIAIDADDILTAKDDTPDESSIDDLIAEQGVKADQLAELTAQNARDAQDASDREQADADAAALADIEVTQSRREDVVATDSVADKLQRIRAVVASKAQANPEYIEDEHAMSGPDGDGNDENDAIDVDAEIPGFTAETDATSADDSDNDAEDNLFADTISAVMSDQFDSDEAEEEDTILPDLSSGVEDETDTQDAVAKDIADDAQSELDALRAKIAELEAQAAKSTAAPVVAEILEPQPEETEVEIAASEEENIDVGSEDALDEDTLKDEESRAPAKTEDVSESLIARVGKAKRSDVEAALASGEIEEYDIDDDDDEADLDTAQDGMTAVPGLEDSSLTPEQEAELARELADLHAEIDEDDDWNFDDDDRAEDDDAPIFSEGDEEAAQASIRKAVKMTSPGRAMLTDTSIEEDDGSVERLADKTETEMDEPEGNRRRSAIAHLRAAVAATKADRILGFGKKTVNEEEPYREDLADAVRPRRPKVAEVRSERPAPVRPAPLKLVAEQRIDKGSAPDAEPVRPRRVRRSAEVVDANDNMAADDAGFAEFADSQGAHTLPELLEAAAAYMSFVEGRDQFSRPQLMTKLLQAEGEASSREERLRSFGQLLRDGKIEKKGGGRFAASDNIGFKPDARAAG